MYSITYHFDKGHYQNEYMHLWCELAHLKPNIQNQN